MPIPGPKKNEKQSDFVSRCISSLSDKGEFTQEQRVAICNTRWQKAKAEEFAAELMGKCKDCKEYMSECKCEEEPDEHEDMDEDTEEENEDKSESNV